MHTTCDAEPNGCWPNTYQRQPQWLRTRYLLTSDSAKAPFDMLVMIMGMWVDSVSWCSHCLATKTRQVITRDTYCEWTIRPPTFSIRATLVTVCKVETVWLTIKLKSNKVRPRPRPIRWLKIMVRQVQQLHHSMPFLLLLRHRSVIARGAFLRATFPNYI